jgi:hypothetical protein
MTVDELIQKLTELPPEQRALPAKIKDECWCCGAYDISYVTIHPYDEVPEFVGLE